VLDGFPLRGISQGSPRNVTVVLPQAHLAAAMSLVHDRFCLPPAEPCGVDERALAV
jgi:hypothetical protein